MNVRRIVGLLALALVVWFVIQQPGAAAGTVESILGSLQGAAQSITAFFTDVVT